MSEAHLPNGERGTNRPGYVGGANKGSGYGEVVGREGGDAWDRDDVFADGGGVGHIDHGGAGGVGPREDRGLRRAVKLLIRFFEEDGGERFAITNKSMVDICRALDKQLRLVPEHKDERLLDYWELRLAVARHRMIKYAETDTVRLPGSGSIPLVTERVAGRLMSHCPFPPEL